MNRKKTVKETAADVKKQAALNTAFAAEIERVFAIYCENNGVEPTAAELAKYMLIYGIVTEREVNRYMVAALFPRALYEADGVKVVAVQALEDQVCLSERTIWSFISSTFHRYKKRKILFS